MQDKVLEQWLSKVGDSQAEKEQALTRLLNFAVKAFEKESYEDVLYFTSLAKSLRTPFLSTDYLRALAFLKTGDILACCEALKEELRWFPDNHAAQHLLQEVQNHLAKSNQKFMDEEFQLLYPKIQPHTMVSPERLQTLFANAKDVCTSNLKGNFVECGVAGGGSSGLLAWVLKQYDVTGRKIFACDSYSGMPPSDENDVHQGVQAEQSNWGTGTCAAPTTSVQGLCTSLDADDRLVIVKGYFCDTLPIWKEQMGNIALLHMDGDWYASTRDILLNLYDNLVSGAYVQIDDYGHWDGCRKAVHEFIKERGLDLKLTPCDYSGVWFRKP